MIGNLGRAAVLKEIQSKAIKYNIRIISLSDMRYRIELSGISIAFESDKITIYDSVRGKIILRPYNIEIIDEDDGIVKLLFYVGRTVGLPYGFIYEIDIDVEGLRCKTRTKPNKTNIYSVYDSIGISTYAQLMNVESKYRSLSTMDYRAIVKGNLPYFNKNISELVSLLSNIFENLPKGNIPKGYDDSLSKLVKSYKSGYDLYVNKDYYKLGYEDGSFTYFKVNSNCYELLKINRFIVDEYNSENVGDFKSIRVLKDKHREFTQYITLEENGAFSIIFNLINNKYYVRFKIFLLDCFDNYEDARNSLEILGVNNSSISEFQDSIIKEVYAL